MPEILKSLWDSIESLIINYHGWAESTFASELFGTVLVGGGLALILVFWNRILGYAAIFFYKEEAMIHFSLNLIADGELTLTTPIRPIPMDELFPNPVHQSVIIKCAKQTTRETPSFGLPLKHEAMIMNIIQGVISAKFAEGAMRAAAGLPTKKLYVVNMLTCEKYSRDQVTKYRVIISAREQLDDIPANNNVKVEEEHHRRRLDTMRSIKSRHGRMPEKRQRRYVTHIYLAA